jgi:hypothetical protein
VQELRRNGKEERHVLSPWIFLVCMYIYILGHYATNRKVTDSTSNEDIALFQLPNPSSRNIALVLTQPLTEVNTRNLSGGGGGEGKAHQAR